MAFTLLGTSTQEWNNETTKTATWPGSITTNSLAVLWVCNWRFGGSAVIPTTPSGFTQRFNVTITGDYQVALYTRECDGTETGTFNVALSNASYGSFCLAVWDGTGDITYDATNSSSTPDDGTASDATAPSISGTSGQLLVVGYGLSDPPGTTNSNPSGMATVVSSAFTTTSTRLYSETLSSTGATGTKTWDYTNSRDFGGAAVLLTEAASGTPVGRADETDTALALEQPAGVSASTETDTALKLQLVDFSVDEDLFLFGDTADDESSAGGLRLFGGYLETGVSSPVGRADETDTAFALSGVFIRALGRSDETDAALALSANAGIDVGRAEETDTAFGLSALLLSGPGLGSETDTAFALGGVGVAATGRADETDAALGLSALLVSATGRADETDAAFGLSSGSANQVGLSEETDSAFALGAVLSAVSGRADETDEAQALGGVESRSVGRSDETDAALQLSAFLSAAVGRADEIDAALELLFTGPQPVGLAEETDEALGLELGGQAVETPKRGGGLGARRGKNYIIGGRKFYDVTREELKLILETEFANIQREQVKVKEGQKKAKPVPVKVWQEVKPVQAPTIQPDVYDEDEDVLLLL